MSVECSLEKALDKKLIAESFSRAATSYDQVAHLQRLIGDALLAQFPWKNALALADFCADNVIVDLGCGTGYFLPKLQSFSPSSILLGVDLAQGMVSYAKGKFPQCEFVVADMDSLPLQTSSCAMIYSSLAVQWSTNLESVLANAYQALLPGGVFMFSTLLDGTLTELAASWQAADNYQHVNSFLTLRELEQKLESAGYADVCVQQQQVVLQYDDVRELTNELKKLGAHNLNPNRAHGMTGKAAIRAFKCAYETFRVNDQLPASYQVAYVYLRKPLCS